MRVAPLSCARPAGENPDYSDNGQTGGTEEDGGAEGDEEANESAPNPEDMPRLEYDNPLSPDELAESAEDASNGKDTVN